MNLFWKLSLEKLAREEIPVIPALKKKKKKVNCKNIPRNYNYCIIFPFRE